MDNANPCIQNVNEDTHGHGIEVINCASERTPLLTNDERESESHMNRSINNNCSSLNRAVIRNSSSTSTFYGSTSQDQIQASNTRSQENENGIDYFNTSKRVRHNSNRNTSTNFEDTMEHSVEDIFNLNVESLNFDSQWNTETEMRLQSARYFGKLQNPVRTGCLRSCLNTGTEALRLTICCIIGIITPMTYLGLLYATGHITERKHYLFVSFTNYSIENYDYFSLVLLGWMILNMMIATFGSIIVYLIEPRVGGSGVPELRSFINGIAVPRVVRLRTLIAKLVGLFIVPIADFPLGVAEPMIHVGGLIAAGISQGRASSFFFDCQIFKTFRTHAERRDFVTAGAAAGFCAAFGTPIAAVLFMMEDVSSYWTQKNVWRTLLTSMVSGVVMTILTTYWNPKEAAVGTTIFGALPDFKVPWVDILLAVIIGSIGGLLGSLFLLINRSINRIRARYQQRWFRILEVMVLSVAFTLFVIPVLWFEGQRHCQVLHDGGMYHPLRMPCPGGHTNSLGLLFCQLPSRIFQSLVHEPGGIFKMSALLLFTCYMFFSSALLYGICLPGGIIMSSLVIGAAWGRLIGSSVLCFFSACFPNEYSNLTELISIEKFAVLGATAQSAGVLRLILAIPVMFAEGTQNISVGLVTAVCAVTAKCVGDLILSIDFYTMWTRLLSLAYLPQEPDESAEHLIALSKLRACDIMSHPVTFVRTTETVGNLVHILRETSHNGFPVVSHEATAFISGQLRGIIDRTTILALLEHKNLYTRDRMSKSILLNADTFQRPRPPTLEMIYKDFSEDDMELRVIIADYMCIAPHVVQMNMSYMRVYALFRTLGLRHLPVVTSNNNLAGLITRKDLARYRWHKSNKCCRRSTGTAGHLYECQYANLLSVED